MLPSIELQGNFIQSLISEAREKGYRTVETDSDVQRIWAETVQAISKVTVFDHVKSWIQNENVEGKQKYSAFSLAGLKTYIAKLNEESAASFPSFVTVK